MKNKNKNKKIFNALLTLCAALVLMGGFSGVPGMALIQSEINRPQVFTAKCSEPQADTIKVGVKEVV